MSATDQTRRRPGPRAQSTAHWLSMVGVALAVGLLPLACGGPLQEAEYAGEPITVFDGVIDQPSGTLTPVPEDTWVAVFWRSADGEWLQAAPGVGPLVDGSDWRLPIYTEPPAAARTLGYAMGRVLPYVDADGDGWREVGEPFRAGADAWTIFWSLGGVTPATGPVTYPVPAGVHQVVGYLPCGEPFPVGDSDCLEAFGCSCAPAGGPGELQDLCPLAEPADCPDEAICDAPDFTPEASRICMAALGDCAPRGGRLLPRAASRASALPESWVPICETDADCIDRLSCSAAQGTCVDAARSRRIRATPDTAEPAELAAAEVPTLCGDPALDAALYAGAD